MADTLKPSLLEQFNALPMQEKKEALEAMQASLNGDIERRRAELMDELAQLGGAVPKAVTPRVPAEKPASDARGTVKPLYRSPDGEEWSGRGRTPRWLVALEAAGRSKDEFRITE